MSKQQSKNKSLAQKYRKRKGNKVETDKSGNCDKISYDLRTAERIAGQRETLLGQKFGVYVCRDGCTTDNLVYHLTKGSSKTYFRKSEPKSAPKKKSGDRAAQKRRRKQRDYLPIASWENEGGSLHPNE